jgi:signal transduction histidine kinase
MKLVYKTILINTIVSVLILFAGQFSLYFFLKNNIQKETVEHLYLERYIMMKQIKKGINIENFKNNIGDILQIDSIPSVQFTTPVIEEIEVEEEGEEEHFTSKKIVFDVLQNNKAYRVSIIKTVDEDEGLAGSMSAIIFISGISMLTFLVIFNVLVYYKLFSPVYQLIKDIKNFSVQQLQKIIPPKTTTLEFVELSEEIGKMSEKMIFDYNSMKEFTENMTHEIQTPLAIINSKIERCMQDKNLTEEQAILLSDAAKSVNKLFTINKGLTLLGKIDNKQYNTRLEINITKLIHQRINYFIDFIENKKITITENFKSEINVLMDTSLSEILIDNLLKNAIQHNFQNGNIFITIENNQLIIANTGDVPKESTTIYFDRFYSQKPQQSLGLGLSIIKKIVDFYGFEITYNYEKELHQISIDFSKKN